MKEKKNVPVTKIIIIVLTVLLILSLLALGGILIYRHIVGNGSTSVVIPDNLINPTGGTGSSDPTEESTVPSDPTEGSTEPSTEPSTGAPTETTVPPSTEDPLKYAGLGLFLHANQATDNTPFAVPNMFPSDVETRYYCVQVCYRQTVTVRYHADIRPGYEKLAEVLKTRITLLTTGEVLYDGLMRDMPDSLNHTLTTKKDVDTQELFYQIDVYLDTSVGNDYQNKQLIADFRWWVEETENLEPPPKTGDETPLLLFGILAGVSVLGIIILIIVVKRKEEGEDEEEEDEGNA